MNKQEEKKKEKERMTRITKGKTTNNQNLIVNGKTLKQENGKRKNVKGQEMSINQRPIMNGRNVNRERRIPNNPQRGTSRNNKKWRKKNC